MNKRKYTIVVDGRKLNNGEAHKYMSLSGSIVVLNNWDEVTDKDRWLNELVLPLIEKAEDPIVLTSEELWILIRRDMK